MDGPEQLIRQRIIITLILLIGHISVFLLICLIRIMWVKSKFGLLAGSLKLLQLHILSLFHLNHYRISMVFHYWQMILLVFSFMILSALLIVVVRLSGQALILSQLQHTEMIVIQMRKMVSTLVKTLNGEFTHLMLERNTMQLLLTILPYRRVMENFI